MKGTYNREIIRKWGKGECFEEHKGHIEASIANVNKAFSQSSTQRSLLKIQDIQL